MISFNRDEPDEYVYHMRSVYKAKLREMTETCCALVRNVHGQKAPMAPKYKRWITITATEWTRKVTSWQN